MLIGSRRRKGTGRRPLLYDHFGKPLPAGSLNGSLPVPGPATGPRTVIDTENKLAIGPWIGGTSLYDETDGPATFGPENNRSSYADGQSWIGYAGADFGAAGLVDGTWYLVVQKDSAGRMAYGYVLGGAAGLGTGEVLGEELVTTWTNHASASFDTFISSGSDITSAIYLGSTAALAYSTLSSATVAKKQYKVTSNLTINSGTVYRFGLRVSSGGGALYSISTVGSSSNITLYPVAYLSFTVLTYWANSAVDFSATGHSVKEVLTPDATCAYVHKSVNGPQGWNMDGNFNMDYTAYTFNLYPLGASRLISAGGKATAAYGDPGLWYPAVTRELGRTVIFGPVTVEDASVFAEIGTDTNTTGEFNGSSFLLNNDKLSTRDGGLNGPQVHTPSDNTPYYLAIRLLAAGAEYYLKTVGGNWKKLWRGGTDATATLYPGISNYSAAFNLSEPGVIVPAELWHPPVLLYDSFGRADGSPTQSESLDADSKPAPVKTYTEVGTWAISSNALTCSALDGGIGMLLADAGVVDTLTDVLVTHAGGTAGIVFRYADADNYIRLIHNGTNVQLIKKVGGSDTTVTNVAAAYAAGTQIRVICEGTKFNAYYNNVLIGTEATIADAGLQTGTKVGVYTDDITNSFDVFSSAARGTNGEYDSLNRYLR